jgi:ribosomal protein L40E
MVEGSSTRPCLGVWVMRCPSCNSDNPDTTKFCGSCGRPLTRRCDKCGAENPPQFKFCGECGTALAANAAPAATSSTQPTPEIRLTPERQASEVIDGERKTVTALFADIKGSMDLIEGLDPEDCRSRT